MRDFTESPVWAILIGLFRCFFNIMEKKREGGRDERSEGETGEERERERERGEIALIQGHKVHNPSPDFSVLCCARGGHAQLRPVGNGSAHLI
jgi:hypothetical protein